MRCIEVPAFVKGLIFDCDGTLVDSMPLHMKAWEAAVRAMGGAWDDNFFLSQKGVPEPEIVRLYNERYRTRLDPAATVCEKHRIFRAGASGFKAIPHVVDVASRYWKILPMAVVSGGSKENVEMELDAIGIKGFFEVILTADDGLRPKPAPDLFLEAAARIGVAPELCQVFEDGDLGLEAARRAGMLPTDIR